MKRHKHPIGNKNCTLWQKICDMDNLRFAHRNAKKGKGWYEEVKKVDEDLEYYLGNIQQMLINRTYKTSEYVTFIKKCSNKEREIYKLPYYPDRICQWAVLQVIEPILMRSLSDDTYSAIPGRGIHQAFLRLRKAVYNDADGTQYCLKFDVKKYYPSIDHEILKQKYRRLFKDNDLLWLIDEIIDSTHGDKGIPIGNYLSQYSGNYYLSSFDHWIKEVNGIKHYYRYMDDIVILAGSKEYLHDLRKAIDVYLKDELKLTIKENWQVFPTRKRGIDFVGYRTFFGYSLLRKSTCKNMKAKMTRIKKDVSDKQGMSFSQWCSINSYKGWLMHCDSYRLQEKYIAPIQPSADEYHIKNIKRNGVIKHG